MLVASVARELRPGRGGLVKSGRILAAVGPWHPSWLDNFLDQWSIPSDSVVEHRVYKLPYIKRGPDSIRYDRLVQAS